jgi:thiosulfate/3-mercaptopyruvate sulfurtransferase
MPERSAHAGRRATWSRRAVAAVVPLTLASAVAAQPAAPRDRMLVTTTWLAEHLADPDLVLLHVGEKAEYDAGHIPGARYITLRDIDGNTSPDGMPLELPAPADLRTRLERLGISDDARIVVYYGNDWISPSTRVIYTLDYAGLGDRTVLLDGGMAAWKREDRRLTTEVPAARTGRLSALKTKDIVVDADWVQANKGKTGVTLIDARDAVFYDGVRESHGAKGHIAGAVSIPFGSMFDDELRLLPQAELAAIFAQAGIEQGETIAVYCHIGQQATAVIFAARALGFAPKLYDGSMHDWGMVRGLPIGLPAKDRLP